MSSTMMDFGMPCTIFAFLRIWPNFTVSGITAWMEKTPDSVLEKKDKGDEAVLQF